MNGQGYSCFACGTTQSSSFSGFCCPACGGNLEVTYHHAAARSGFLAGLEGPSARSDLFRYAALLPVHDLELAPPLRVGQTPLYRADRLAATAGLQQVWVKDDGLNPSASFKDRAGAVALVVARERKAAVIAGATTGNAGSSMACLAASVGQPCVIFLPEKAPPAKIAQLLVFGAKVIAVRGSYDQAFDLCVEVCRARGWFNRNTGSNPFTREGKKTCSFEIWEQLGRRAPDWVAVSSGDGNILSGVWKGWCDLKAMGLIERLPRLLCAQAHASNAISRAVWHVQRAGRPPTWAALEIEPVHATTLADSISVDQPRDGLAAVRAVIESRGIAVTVPDEEILAAIPELARNSGVFAEPAASCAWACVKKAAREGQIRRDETVVCLSTGNGLKDIGNARKSVGEPHVVDASLDAVQRALGEGC
jgi:threonine synthase